MNKIIIRHTWLILVFLSISISLKSQVQPNHIFDDNMVLQREKPVKVWGWASPGELVKVEFNNQIKSAVTFDSGEWFVYLDPMDANSSPQIMTVYGENNQVAFTNVLVGDVWILGGQSNMEFDLARIFHGDVEILSANLPNIRLMTIPMQSSVVPVDDFKRINEYDGWYNRYDEKGYWFVCSPERVETFSGLGFVFGKRIHLASQVPIGLIDASRGGTTIETWLSPEMLASTPENQELLEQWQQRVDEYDPEENLKNRIRNWEIRTESRRQQGLEPGPKPEEPDPSPIYNHNFPGSCYNGMVAVFAGLSAKGILFHHGYNNALGDARPNLYALNFKSLIADWRRTFEDEDMPFGIIELSAGGNPQTMANFERNMIDAAPYIREAQFIAFKELSNTGFASAYDEQVNWYHPQKKVELSERMARWALATYYGFDIQQDHALFTGAIKNGDQLIVSFSEEVKSSDDRPFEGFAIAGNDKRFYPARAEYLRVEDDERGQAVYDKKRLVVWSDLVSDPTEIRYAWARNPLGNLINARNRVLPVPLFRTDDWDYPEAPYDEARLNSHRTELREMQRQADEWAMERAILEAEKILEIQSIEE